MMNRSGPSPGESAARGSLAPFESLDCPLEGTTLIEASAGTGKTYTIATLYLRLLIERELPVDSILVVTFTEAATAELRHRIRTRIREAYEFFRNQQGIPASGDDLLNHLARTGGGENRKKADLLARALHGFDEAAIHTIHAFCRRILTERAFESGALFDAELGKSPERLTRSAAEDFWRKETAALPPLLVQFLAGSGIGPGTVAGLAARLRERPDAVLLPKTDDLETIRERVEALFGDVAAGWASGRSGIHAVLTDVKGESAGLQRRAGIYKVGDGLEKNLEWMDAFAAAEGADRPFDPGVFRLFTISGLNENLKANKPAPEHPFFRLAEKYAIALESYRIAFLRKGVDRVWEDAAGVKEEDRIFDFSDLILGLRDALFDAKSGGRLTAAVASRYKAALIDEFQDTDAAQYAIFSNLFGGGTLFLIGDPKQAIYSFRGADVHAYLGARDGAVRAGTLETNWRAASRLVRAVNRLFESAGVSPFLEDIDFHTVRPAERGDPYLLESGGAEEAPLVVWRLDNTENPDKSLNKENATELAAEATTAEIADLLEKSRSGTLKIVEEGGERPVNPRDIAVLVRFHKQAEMVRRKLDAAGIPTVLQSQLSVFESASADDLELVLRAAADPSNETAVRAAYTTVMLGGNAVDLFETITDPDEWEKRLEAFSLYGRLWRTRGFMAMFEILLVDEQVRPKLLARPDGVRRLTDLSHLGELLHGEWRSSRPSPAGLVAWLAAQMTGGGAGDSGVAAEARQLRLETDADAVRLVTVHTSKGLQYPIVFCPFMWDTRAGIITDKKKPVFFHEKTNADRRQCVDLGSADIETSRGAAFREELAEEIRLLYVALTRARFKCYTSWGFINKTLSSAPGYLFHAGEFETDPVTLTRKKLEKLVKNRINGDSGSVESFWSELAGASGGTISVEQPPRGPVEFTPAARKDTGEPPAPRRFGGRIDTSWRILSYSGLLTLFDAPHDAPRSLATPAPAPAATRSVPSGSGYEEKAPPDLSDEPDHDRISPAVFAAPAVSAAPAASAVPAAFAAPTAVDEDAESIFTFPAGKRTGDCFHEIFEYLDFTDSAGIEPLVSETLESYGFAGEEKSALVAGMVRDAVATEIAPGLKLEDVSLEDRLSELEFFFPVTPEATRGLLALSPGRGGGSGSRVRGVMKGYIDLVCRSNDKYYVIDYKSNRLGFSLEDYSRECVASAMTAHDYHLQYLIYTVAVHLLLEQRLPGYRYERNFGGACYLFLRGMRPDLGLSHGVFFNRPDAGVVSRLAGLLRNDPGGAGGGSKRL